jgi:hypothetical protein
MGDRTARRAGRPATVLAARLDTHQARWHLQERKKTKLKCQLTSAEIRASVPYGKRGPAPIDSRGPKPMPELVSLTACKMGVNQGAGGKNILNL